MTQTGPDHGGQLDAARARFGGTRADWLDLSTGINPVPYPVDKVPSEAWASLPDRGATDVLVSAARAAWRVPDGAEIVPAPGASALISRLPTLVDGVAFIPGPTYNEHAIAFGPRAVADPDAPNHVYVHPNNPDGRLWPDAVTHRRRLTLIDESFCDVQPEASLVSWTDRPDVAVIKSFGKFWGLAGLRLGFLIAMPALARAMCDALGPWPVSGPALAIGARALADRVWIDATRRRLARDAARLDRLMTAAGARVVGGTTLFRLFDVPNAASLHEQFAQARILTRTFSYNSRWLRLGLPAPHKWVQLEAALADIGGTRPERVSRTHTGTSAPSG